MMSPRRVLSLLVAGVVVIGFALWMASHRELEPATIAGDAVLPGLQAVLNQATEVRLVKGDGARTTLKKLPAEWLVAERGYPADSGRVRKLLLDLGALQVIEEKTREPGNYALLGVEDVDSPKATGTRVQVVTPAKTFGLIVGKASDTKSVFVRLVGAPGSLLASPQIVADADPKHWLERAVVDIGQDRVKQVAIDPASGPSYSVARPAKQADFAVTGVPKGRELASPSAADPLAGAAAALQADDVRRSAPAAATAPKSDQAKIATFDGLEIVFTGLKDGDRRYVTVAATGTAAQPTAEAKTINARTSGWDFELPAYRYDAIFKPLEDLLKKPEPAAKAQLKKSPNHAGAALKPGAVRAGAVPADAVPAQ